MHFPVNFINFNCTLILDIRDIMQMQVRAPMKENINSTQITFPVELTSEKDIGCMAEVHWITLATRVLESRLLSLLRFKYGEVYSVSVRDSLVPHVDKFCAGV